MTPTAPRLTPLLLLAALALGAPGGHGAAQAAPAPATSATGSLVVTPPRSAPGPRVHAVVHLDGLTPGVAVEVQVNPPAPAMGILVDDHLHASGAGTVSHPITFAAPDAGAYLVFVNVGQYADARSPARGYSLSAVVPVAAHWPLLALPCPQDAGHALCQLSGYGFLPHERVTITYTIRVGTPAGQRTTVSQRATVADARGILVRPLLRLILDARHPTFRVTVTARGSGGSRAQIATSSTP